MRLIEARHPNFAVTPYAITVGVELEDAAEGQALVQGFAEFSLACLHRLSFFRHTQQDARADDRNLDQAERALRFQIKLAEQIDNLEDPRTPFDFVPDDSLQVKAWRSDPDPKQRVATTLLHRILIAQEFELTGPSKLFESATVAASSD